MCEHSVVNQAAALRREARRRKILENSTNRLRLIEGINTSLDKSDPLPESPTLSKHVTNDFPKTQSDSKLSDIIRENKELKEISDFLRKGDENEEEVTLQFEEKKWQFSFLLEKRLHYILLAVVVNALLFINAGYLFYENIFCPFYTVKTIELISRREDKKDFHPFVFLFVAGLPKSIQKFTKIILTVLSALLSDLLLYLFTFIIGTKILNIQVY